MRVVFAFAGAELGGAERSLSEWIADVARTHPQWQLTALMPSEGPLQAVLRQLAPQCTQHILPYPVRLASVGQRQWWSTALAVPALWRYRRRIRAFLSAQSPHWIHSNGNKMHLLMAAAKPKDAALLVHLRDYPTGTVMPPLLKAIRPHVARWVANSHSVAQRARQSLSLHTTPTVRYNHLPLGRFLEARRQPVAPLCALSGLVASTAPTIGLVATYARWKGQDVLIDALALLAPGLKWRAYIVGSPVYQSAGSQWDEAELRARIAGKGLSDRVGLVPFQSHPSQVFAALDIAVHAAVQPEPFGRVLVEAMASGCALVAADGGGARELIEPHTTALLHTPGDAHSLAAALTTLLRDRALRSRLQQNGAAAMRQAFGQPLQPQDIATLYAP